MNTQSHVKRQTESLLRWMLISVTLSAGCNSSSDMPPPNKPQPEKQSTAAGLEMAEKLYAAVQAKDAAAIGTMRDEINRELQGALQSGEGDREHDYGRLNAIVYLTDQGDWEKAEETLQELIRNSKAGSDP